MPRSSKRPVSPVQVVKGSSKRRRAAPLPDPKDVIIVGSDAEESEDEELKAILAQIEAQERHIKKPAKKRGEPIASGSKSTPIDLEDDAAMARILAQQWASEDNNGGASSDVEILDGPSISHVNERRPSSPKTRELSISSRFKSRSPHLHNSGIYQSSSIKPDGALEPFKDLFTKTRQCSKCKKSVDSPRGYVSVIYLQLNTKYRNDCLYAIGRAHRILDAAIYDIPTSCLMFFMPYKLLSRMFRIGPVPSYM